MSYAIVTPSFGPDFERCRLLCESLDEFVTGDFRHVVIVDERDRRLFKPLEGPRTDVLTVESVLPWWLRRMPCSRRWWLSFKTPPVRNWVLQQLVKLSVAEFLDHDNYVFVDSDVVFVRPFGVGRFTRDGRLRLWRVQGAANKFPHIHWHRAAAKVFGLPMTDYFGSTYVGNLITWRRANLQAMYRHLEKTRSRPWLEVIAGQWRVSEYILYGIFCEHVLGLDAAGHFVDDVPLCHISWDYSIATEAERERFFSELGPGHVSVMVSSKQEVPVSEYRRYLPEPLREEPSALLSPAALHARTGPAAKMSETSH